jgi:hypothetical protein
MQGPSTKELNAMTFQVGLVGSDGLVIASDRRLQNFENGQLNIDDRYSKFFKPDGLACCWSGDDVARRASHNIERAWRDVPFGKSSIRHRLEMIGDMTWTEQNQLAGQQGILLNPGVNRKVIVGCHDELWLLEVGLPRSLAQQHGRIVAGDLANTARHFINKYGHHRPAHNAGRICGTCGRRRKPLFHCQFGSRSNSQGESGSILIQRTRTGFRAVLEKSRWHYRRSPRAAF